MNGKKLLKEKDKPKKLRVRPMRLIEDDLWDLCKKITRILYKDCYTCSQRNIQGLNCQTGHMHPKGACGASMKYDLRILRLQCFQCNINHGGMGAAFLENMKKEIGSEMALELLHEAQSSKGNTINVGSRKYYLNLIEEYKKYFNEIKSADISFER